MFTKARKQSPHPSFLPSSCFKIWEDVFAGKLWIESSLTSAAQLGSAQTILSYPVLGLGWGALALEVYTWRGIRDHSTPGSWLLCNGSLGSWEGGEERCKKNLPRGVSNRGQMTIFTDKCVFNADSLFSPTVFLFVCFFSPADRKTPNSRFRSLILPWQDHEMGWCYNSKVGSCF